jgi:hypothetical protein
MVSANRSNSDYPGFATQSESRWRPRLFVGAVLFLGVVVLFCSAYAALSARYGWRQSPEEPLHAVSAQAAASPNAPTGSASSPSLESAAPALGHREPTTPGLAQAPKRCPAPAVGSEIGGRTAPNSAAYLSRRSPERLEMLYDANLGGWIAGADAAQVNQMLQDLRDRGSGALPAIREFLERMEDIEFGDLNGEGDLVESSSLRLALFDMLGEIGGGEAIDIAMAQLGMTGDPLEIAILAQKLEELAPGSYQPELLKAANDALRWAASAPREERPDVGPLFELLQAYGGPEVVRDVAQETGQWWEYSLMALAGLPEGEGIPVLITEAYNPTVPLEHKSQFPVQMLAQAAAQSPEAQDALLDLARSGGIPDTAWEAIADTLAGKHMQFPNQLFAGPALEGTGTENFEATAFEGDQTGGFGVEAPKLRHYYIEYLNMSYDQRLASANWSDEQIGQQLALIEDLRNATSNPVALSALEEAEQSLRGDG